MSLIGAFVVPHPPLIVPEIGKGEQSRIQKTIDSYKAIAKKIALLKPETIIITTPHSVLYSDYIHISPEPKAKGSFKDFGAPSIQFEVDYDETLIKMISSLATSKNIAAGTKGEKSTVLDHATMVPLYFVNQYYNNFKLVRISLSGLSDSTHYQFGMCINEAVQQSKKRVVLISSGDLSHKLTEDGPYGFAKEGPIFDKKVTNALSNGDFMELFSFDEDFLEKTAECGLRSFLMLAGALDGKSIESELLSYEGPFGVGYAIASFKILKEDKSRQFGLLFEKQESSKLRLLREKEDSFVKLARKSLEYYIHTHKKLDCPINLEEELLKEKAGVFVSLKMDNRLRGCIGTIYPTTKCIAYEIIQNAISAGTQDPRFPPVLASELSKLVISVDVLGKKEAISSLEELDVLRYGVIVSSKGKSGLLLPNLSGITTPFMQVQIALQKAGINKEESYSMERFEVIRHH
ncbi:MAG: AmmeMemoRadiSam system protein A [Firmicutes bacterium]|nr:AmmeMemoRadiSam system protein A [Bacillota bacterium]